MIVGGHEAPAVEGVPLAQTAPLLDALLEPRAQLPFRHRLAPGAVRGQVVEGGRVALASLAQLRLVRDRSPSVQSAIRSSRASSAAARAASKREVQKKARTLSATSATVARGSRGSSASGPSGMSRINERTLTAS